MRERVLAVIGAVCLIAVAVLVRSAIVGDDGSGDGGSDGGADRDELPVVACTPDLEAICEALADDGTIAADPPTLELDAAAAPPEDVDGWITWDPAHQVANFVAEVEVWQSPEVLASAPLAVVGRAEDLDVACREGRSWSCVREADEAGLAIGVGDPSTAEGLARLLPVARTYAVDDDHTTLELGLQALVDGPVDGQATAAAMARDLVVRPGRSDVVVGPTETLMLQAGTARGRALDLFVAAPDPGANATIVVAEQSGGAATTVRDAVCELSADDLAETPVGAALLDAVGSGTCRGDLVTEQLAGFLFQVRKELS